MELELGLKITRPRDDFTSFSGLHIAKDQTGPVFLSIETETLFILIVYLKGFRRENIDININEEGTRITVSGKKPVQEMVLMSWMMHKKEVELRAFRKLFRIPDGVILDRIKAKFRRDEGTLTIFMPKLVKGIRGVVIEEVKEVEVGTSSVDDKGPQEEIRETEDKGMEEVEQEDTREIDESEPEIAPIEADQVPSELKVEEREEKIEPQIERGETSQVEEQVAVQGQSEVPETEDKEVETGKIMEEKVDVEAKKIEEVVAGIEPGRVEDQELENPEIEDAIEEAEAPPSAAIEEPLVKGLPAAEETQKEEEKEQEAPGAASARKEEIVEHIDRPESPELTKPEEQVSQEPEEPQPPYIEAEKEHIGEPNHREGGEMLQESEKQEPESTVLELPTKPEPDREREQAEVPRFREQTEQPEMDLQKETPGIGNEIEEAVSDHEEIPEARGVEEHEFPKLQENKDLDKRKAATSRPRKRSRKPCPPRVISGSAILFSLIVLVISLIRAKKR